MKKSGGSGTCTGLDIPDGIRPHGLYTMEGQDGGWQFDNGDEGLTNYPHDRRHKVPDMKSAIYSHIGQLAVVICGIRFVRTASLTRSIKEDGSCSELFLVTCAHNIVLKDVEGRCSLNEITEGTFYWHQKGKGHTALKLKKWAYYPKYGECKDYSATISGYDYAIATIEQPQMSPPSCGRFISHSSLLEEVEKGVKMPNGKSLLRVSGYEQHLSGYEQQSASAESLPDTMLSMTGPIAFVFHMVDQEHGLIFYDIDTTRGQSGAPLFAVPPFTSRVTGALENLNRSQNAKVNMDTLAGIRCGVHVGTDGHRNYATMETKAIATWRYGQLKKWGVV